MLNVILSDIYKNRKNKIFYICALLVIIFSLWYSFRYVIVVKPPEDFHTWLNSAVMMSSIVLSVASGFVITFFVQREYAEKTIINILSAPTHRISFVLSKLTVWFIWFLLVSVICISLLIIGAELAYDSTFGKEELILLISRVSVTYLFSFIASTPLLLVTFVQKHLFYPSLMCALVMTAFQMFTSIMPVKYSEIIPWSASLLYGLGAGEQYVYEALIPVLTAGVLGTAGACMVFRKQDL